MTIFVENKNFSFLDPCQNWVYWVWARKKIAHQDWFGNISKCHQEGPNNTLKQKNYI